MYMKLDIYPNITAGGHFISKYGTDEVEHGSIHFDDNSGVSIWAKDKQAKQEGAAKLYDAFVYNAKGEKKHSYDLAMAVPQRMANGDPLTPEAKKYMLDYHAHLKKNWTSIKGKTVLIKITDTFDNLVNKWKLTSKQAISDMLVKAGGKPIVEEKRPYRNEDPQFIYRTFKDGSTVQIREYEKNLGTVRTKSGKTLYVANVKNATGNAVESLTHKKRLNGRFKKQGWISKDIFQENIAYLNEAIKAQLQRGKNVDLHFVGPLDFLIEKLKLTSPKAVAKIIARR